MWCFWQFDGKVQLATVLAGLLSMAYVLPWLGGRRRLRDLNYLKIFLIAFVWAWVSVVLPALALHLEWSIPVWILFLERLLFIFAITLPFDIRDLEVDAHNRVLTLPAVLGLKKTRILAAGSLFVMLLLSLLNYWVQAYSAGAVLGLGCSVGIAYGLIHFSPRFQHDYYFSGLLDGMMILQFLIIYTLTKY